MNKVLFLLGLLFSITLLLGCRKESEIHTIVSLPVIIEQKLAFDLIFSPDTGTYDMPDIKTNYATGLTLSEFTGKARNEISYTASQEDIDNGWKRSTVTGYVYTYTYKDLGIQITTPPLYEPYFYEIPRDPIFHRINNIVYKSGATNLGGEYIQMFEKNGNESLKSVIEKNHLGKGCIAFARFTDPQYDQHEQRREKWHGIDINNFYDITGPNGSLGTDIECSPDRQFPKNQNIIMFFQSLAHKDRYYKISMGDGCAPGPCSIFGTIEFF